MAMVSCWPARKLRLWSVWIKSLELANTLHFLDLEALAHLNMGTLYTVDRERDAAASLAAAIEKGAEAERSDIVARALINRARFFVDVVKNKDEAERDLSEAASIILGLDNGAEKAPFTWRLGGPK